METNRNTSWLIENGRIIDPSQRLDRVGRLLLIGGRIAALDPLDGDVPADCSRVDAGGCIVAPGLVDIATELGEPGLEEDETIATGTMAALAGGFTSLACSASTDPPIDTASDVEFVRQKAAKADNARVYVIGCVSKGRGGEELAEIGSLVEAGAIALSDSPLPMGNTALLRKALEYCLMFNRPIIDRPEVRSLTRRCDARRHDPTRARTCADACRGRRSRHRSRPAVAGKHPRSVTSQWHLHSRQHRDYSTREGSGNDRHGRYAHHEFVF